MSQTYAYTVEMTCGGCEKAVRKVIGKLGDKVTNLEIDLKQKKVAVTTDLPQDEVTEALKKTGKTVTPL
ncbi:Heavy metal-associated domain containing protein [Aphelenchoides avenae]|nr:Heavy metal-associated domain containing protein [Aphelenchus avenae]